MKRQNEGFSLIELVITMAIMAILTGLVALGTGMIGQAETKHIAESVNVAFSDLKTENMSKTGPVYMHLFQYEGNYYIEMHTLASCVPSGDYGELIGTTDTKIELDGVELMDGDVWTFNISKKDGAFQTMSGVTTVLDSASTITVSERDGKLKYDIVLVRDTGRHYIER